MEKAEKNLGSWWHCRAAAQALDSLLPYGLNNCYLQPKALLTEMIELGFGSEFGKPKMLICY